MTKGLSLRRMWIPLFCMIMASVMAIHCARRSDLEAGVEALERGQYGKALTSLRSAWTNDSLNPEVHYNLCLVYIHLDSSKQALAHYLKLEQLDSARKHDRDLRELIAVELGLEPYPASIIPMRRLNQFKGAFSPLNDLIALAASTRDKADIYVAQLDGSNIKRIISGGMNTDPDFSPDGSSVVFVSDRDGGEDLYLYDLESGETRRITDNAAEDFAPSFSPDGKEVVYVSNRDDPYKWEIYAVNIATRRIRRLTDNNYWDGFPRFTGNGRSVVFSSKRNGSEDIFVMRVDGGAQELLFSSPADDNDPTLIQDNLFFKSQMNGEWEIYQYNVRTKRLIRLTNNACPDWSPQVSDDGRKMLVSRKIRGRWVLHFINLDEPLAADFLVAEIRRSQGG